DNLLKINALTKEEADHYEIESLQKNQPIDQYLLENSKLKKEDILQAKGSVLNFPVININTVPIAPQALSLIPESISRRYNLIPFELNENEQKIKVAMDNPFDLQIIEFLEKKTTKKIEAYLALKDDIVKSIDVFYTQGLSPDIVEALKEVQPEVKTIRSDQIGNFIKEAPIAKIVSTILEYAIKGRASDIHIEPQETRTRVRYRIDGILQEKLALPKGIHDSLVSRIKILSELKIDEKRIPQDGRFNFKTGEEEVDLRVSTLPTVHGEKVVMRLLKKTGGIPTLMDLGLRGPQLKVLEEAISKPYGIVLVTGPTGSGKSTTLYSLLNRLNVPGVNIVTLEDPVEYQLAGVNQVQINAQAGLTFAAGLRSFLRQDPNIILVGEIRDTDTTQLAIQAALTGHLVFSTLHTNNAATAIPRLIDLGAEPFLIASVLNASMAQRICRRICTFCKASYVAPPEVIQNIKDVLGNFFPKTIGTTLNLYRGSGCVECNNTGYLGRIAIFEVIKISQAINKMIVQHTTAKEIESVAEQEGLIKMKQDGYLKVIEGMTTIEEVLRVAEI
ncbi:MAG TPA: GspE/PulE family protein, partial [Candidatus Nitrosocosmicus sp.]|nr:GspE/PulE family protein [Candidatus Nitrosocosmicus sp.]